MSRHRVKNVGYDDDDDDYYDDDGYESPDPEELEFLQQCTTAVLQQLRAGQPPVTATKEEVQEALWHYYNDVGKSVQYLRGMSGVLHRASGRSLADPGLLRVRRQEGEGDAEATGICCVAEANGYKW